MERLSAVSPCALDSGAKGYLLFYCPVSKADDTLDLSYVVLPDPLGELMLRAPVRAYIKMGQESPPSEVSLADAAIYARALFREEAQGLQKPIFQESLGVIGAPEEEPELVEGGATDEDEWDPEDCSETEVSSENSNSISSSVSVCSEENGVQEEALDIV